MAGDVQRSARALRRLGALAGAGLSITVVCLPGTDIQSALPGGVTTVPVKVQGSGGPRFFRALHQAFFRVLSEIPARLYHASDLYVLAAVHASAAQRPSTSDPRALSTPAPPPVARSHPRRAGRPVP